jgi:WD40 repeat protein
MLTAIEHVTKAQTDDPSRTPILRIETGMHTAHIWRIGVDAANLYLVSASDDRTARIWELSTGRLLRVIRPPIGKGNEGILTAIAISPDGKTFAVGGWTGYEWDKSNSVYVFERESGRLIRRLTGLRWVVLHLAYSKDGRYLAVTTTKNGGIRVFKTDSYTLVGKDADYEDRCNEADFDVSNRLVTASHDGFVRLYELRGDGSLRLIAKRQMVGEGKPAAVRFSPDGSKVVVGYENAARINIISGLDLSPLYSPDTKGIDNNELSKVAWSSDGNILYAGGYYNEDGIFQIRAWSNGGSGKYLDIPVSTKEVMHILPLRDGGIAYSSADPVIGSLDANNDVNFLIGSSIASNKENQDEFLLSSDSSTIQFYYSKFDSSHARFSIANRMLDFSEDHSVRLHPPLTTAKGLSVTDWVSTAPKLNGKLLALEPHENARSLAFTPDGQYFLLGTDFYLRLFDRNGSLHGSIQAPTGIQAVNVSDDGRFIVVACGDGTMRWYRTKDGRELLSFFPHGDGKRWVLWSPSGFYDASPGGEDLIGWHVNRGRDEEADFFPAGQFREVFYRPDVISKVLKAGDEQEALRLANEEAGRPQQPVAVAAFLPPVVEIITPTDGAAISSTDVIVRFRVRTPSGEPVTGIRTLIDGRPANVARELAQQGTESNSAREIRLSVPERDCRVSIIAENRLALSVPATVSLKWRGKTIAAKSGTLDVRPSLYILAVGVSKYANPKYNLRFADKDARDFINSMLAQKGLLYRNVVIYHGKSLTNEEATKDEILEGLDWISKETTSNDVAMVFFSGHGVNDRNNYYYFCPYNVDPDHLLRTGVAFSDIKNALSIVAGKALFFVDTCHSGNSLGLGGRRGGIDINLVVNELSSAGRGVVVFSASTSSESSYEREEWKNGAFTKSLVEGLNGAVDDHNTGRITYTMLHLFISERVKALTKGEQHPTMIPPQTIPDFPIALKR